MMGRGYAGKGAQKTTPREATTPTRRPKATERAAAPSLPSDFCVGGRVGAGVGTRQAYIMDPPYSGRFVQTPSLTVDTPSSLSVVQLESAYDSKMIVPLPVQRPRRAA